jgi:hypothetical protein
MDTFELFSVPKPPNPAPGLFDDDKERPELAAPMPTTKKKEQPTDEPPERVQGDGANVLFARAFTETTLDDGGFGLTMAD